MFCIQWVWTATVTASMDKKQIILATFATLPLCKCVFQIGHAFPNAYEYHEINSKMDPQVLCLHIALLLYLVSALQHLKGGCEEMRRRSRMFWIYLSRLSHSKCGVRNIFLSSHHRPQGRFCPPGLDNILCIKGWYIMGFDCQHKAQILQTKD